MATVYFVREGSGNDRTNEGRKISLTEIADAFPNCDPICSQNAPIFNPDISINPVSAFRYVVVHVQGGESAGKFTKDGYWLLKDISPTEFHQKFPSR